MAKNEKESHFVNSNPFSCSWYHLCFLIY